MILVGRCFYHERLSNIQRIAVGFATMGVLCELLNSRCFSFVPLVIMVGFPPYFALKRRLKCSAFSFMMFEHVLLSPLALGCIFSKAHSLSALGHGTVVSWFIIAGLGIISGTALLCAISASRKLPFSMFGMLSYLEPLLLFMVSLILPGEKLTPATLLTYIPIWIALLLLIVDGYTSAQTDFGK